MKLLDCTLRDGGYYTNWDFSKPLVDQYIKALNDLPIDYIEVGYRSPLLKSYHGKYYYMPLYELRDLRAKSRKKLVIILNEKDVREEHLLEIVAPIVGCIDMVRIAVDPQNMIRAIELAKKIKEYGFEIGFNVMYMSKWKGNSQFFEDLEQVNTVADSFYMVDSYGGVFPEDVKEIVSLIRPKLSCELGFHGHNNLEQALSNTLMAMQCGVTFLDTTILGMGRGAGNLKTELLLTVLNQKENLEVNFNALADAVSAFEPLLKKYRWGTMLPYMISGSNSLAQKDVMEWVTTRFYSFNSIIRALDNKKNQVVDNEKYPIYDFTHAEEVLVVGGGPSVGENIDGLLAFLGGRTNINIIHASAKNASYFTNLPNKQYFCLVGNEGYRLEKTMKDFSTFNGICVLPPFPREMGTYVPSSVKEKTFELELIDFSSKYQDAHTTLAFQIAKNIHPNQLYMVGYDGYDQDTLTKKEMDLNKENEYLFSLARTTFPTIESLTKTNYSLRSNSNLYFKLSN